MVPSYVIYLILGVCSVVGVAVLLAFTRWLESQSQELQYHNQSIRILDEGRVYVELRALKQDEGGYFIPGYGRIRQTWENTDADPLRQLPEVKRWKGKVAFICHDKTAPTSDVREYVIGEIVPL